MPCGCYWQVGPDARVVKTAANAVGLDRRVTVLLGRVASLANDIGKVRIIVDGHTCMHARMRLSPDTGRFPMALWSHLVLVLTDARLSTSKHSLGMR